MSIKKLSGISNRFQLLSQALRQVAYVLLTRSPLSYKKQASCTSFDLHVLGTPPAFILSQDQTLHLILCSDNSDELFNIFVLILLKLYVSYLVFKDHFALPVSLSA